MADNTSPMAEKKGPKKDQKNKKHKNSNPGASEPPTKKHKTNGSAMKAAGEKGAEEAQRQEAAEEYMSQSMKRKQATMEKKKSKNPNFDAEHHLRQQVEEFHRLDRQQKKHKRLHKNAIDESLQMRMSKRMDSIVKGIRGNGYKYAVKPDMSRVVQAALKHGTAEHRRSLYENEFKDHLVEMSANMHAHHIVDALFNYVCASSADLKDVRSQMFREFEGVVMNRLTKRFAAKTIDYIYSNIANKEEKFLMTREFYGTSDISLMRTPDQLEDRTIAEVLREQPGKRLVVAQQLNKLVKKCIEKGLFDYHIIHQLISDLFEIGEKTAVTDVVSDLIESNAIPFILHTKNGCKVAIYTVSYASAQKRKALIKSLKENAGKAARDAYGVILLCRIFDVVDDVKTSGILLKELKSELFDIITDPNACKVILHLLSAYNKSYFKNPLDLQLLIPQLRRQVITTHEQQKEAIKQELERKRDAFGEEYAKKVTEADADEADAMDESEDKDDDDDDKTSNTVQDKFLHLVCLKPMLQKHKQLFTFLTESLLDLIAKKPSALLSNINGANVVFETLRVSNLDIVCGSKTDIISLRRKALNRVVDVLVDNDFTLLKEFNISRTICKLILCEGDDVQKKEGEPIEEADLFIPRLFQRFKGNFASLIEAHSSLAFPFSALLKSAHSSLVAGALREFEPMLPKLQSQVESSTHAQTKKGLNLLVKVLSDKVQQ